MSCPNKNLEDWKLLEKHNPTTAYSLWDKFNGNVPNKYLGKADRVETNPFTTTDVPQRLDTQSKISKIISEIGKGMSAFNKVDDKSMSAKDVVEKHNASINWFNSNDISKHISFERAFHIVNSEDPNVVGNFSNSTITLYKNSLEGDMYHEAWHGFTQMYLTLSEKKELYDSVRKNKGSFKLYNGESISFESATYEQVEEYLAEKFKSYMLKGTFPKNTSNVEKSIFKSILNFLKGLFSGTSANAQILDRNSSQLQNDLFEKLRIGNLSSMSFSEKNMMFKSLNSTIQAIDKKSELQALSPMQSTEVYNMINSLFSQYLDYSNKGLTYDEMKALDQAKFDYAYSEKGSKKKEDALATIKKFDKVTIKYNLESFKNVGFVKQSYNYSKAFIGNRYKQLVQEQEKESKKENPNTDKIADIQKKIDLMKWTFDNFGDETYINIESMEQNNSVTSYHRRRSKEFLDMNTEISFEELDDADSFIQEIEDFAHKEGSSSMQQLADKEIIFLLKSLHEISPDGTLVYDEYGVPKLEKPKAVWQRLAKITEKDLSEDEIYKTLVIQAENVPIIKQLLDKLGSPDTIEQKQTDMWTKFGHIFGMAKVPLFQQSVEATETDGEQNIKSTVGQAQSDTSKVIKSWNGQFETAHDKNYTYTSEGVTYLDIEKVLKDFPDAKIRHQAVDFFNAIGLYLVKNNATIDILSKANDAKYIRQHLVNLNKHNLKVTDLKSLSKEYSFKDKETDELVPINSIDGNLKNVASLEINYGTTRNSAMVTNAKGDVQFDLILNNFITTTANAINKANTLDDLYAMPHMSYLNPERNPAAESLLILSSLFDENGNKRLINNDKDKPVTLNAKMISGLFLEDLRNQKVEKDGESSFGSSEIDKWGLDFHMFVQGNVLEMMRHADKKTSFSMGVDFIYRFDGSEVGDRYIPTKIFEENDLDMIAKKSMYAFLPKIQAEMKRIAIVKKQLPENSYYNRIQNGDKFTMFDGVLQDSTKEMLYKLIDKNELDLSKLSKVNLEKIESDISNYFKGQIATVTEKLDNSYSVDNLSKTSKDKLISSFVYNSWIHNTEMFGLIYGDLVQYKDFFKRSAGAGSNGGRFRTDTYMLNYLNSRSRAYSDTLENGYEDYDGTLKTAIIKENTVESIYAEDFIKALVKDGVPKETAENYLKMDEADGQGYITFDSYRLLKMSNATWTDAQEQLYQKIVSGEKLSGEKIAEYFPPMKPHYYGPLKTEGLPIQAFHKYSLAPMIPTVIAGTTMEKLHTKMIKEGIDYVTFQSGSKVGSHTKEAKNKKGEVIKDSDGKVQYESDKFYEDISDRSKLSEEPFTPNVIYTNFLKEQFPISNKRKGKTVLSTQKRALAIDNIYSDGVPKSYAPRDENNRVIKDKNKRKERWEKNKRKNSNPSHKRANDFIRDIEALTEYKKQELIEEVGMSYINKKLVFNNVSISKLLGFVEKNLTRADLTENDIDFLALNESVLKNDLSLSLNADIIEKLLDAVVVNRIVKQKVTGEGLVHLSTSFMELTSTQENKFKAPTESQKKKYGTNDLPFYYQMDDTFIDENQNKIKRKKTAAMKVKIALSNDFKMLLDAKDLDGNRIGTIENLNRMLKSEDWLMRGDNRAMVTLTGERIPVQGMNSIEFMEVYEFLEEEAGSIIITPSEIVVKSGTDFDVDKMTVMMPNIMRSNGNVQMYKFTEKDVDEAYDKYKKKYKEKNDKYKEETAFKSREEFKAERFNKGKELENNLIGSIRALLELEENFTTLIRPNGTDILENIAKDLAPVASTYTKTGSPTQTLELETSMYKHTSNSVGMETLGIGAIDNKYNPIFNAIGMFMSESAGISRLEYEKISSEANLLNSKEIKSINDIKRIKELAKEASKYFPQYLMFNHNKTLDGNISLAADSSASPSKVGTKEVTHRISDIINQMINGWVDVAKDSWIFNIQGNKEISPTLLFLIQSGVEIETAIYFVSQPMVREYVKEIQEVSSMKTKIESPEDYSKGPLAKINSAKKIFDKYYRGTEVDAYNRGLRKIQKGELKLSDLKESVDKNNGTQAELDIFMHFLQVEKMADKITELKRATNFDTKGRKTYFDALQSIETIKELKEDISFGEDMVNNILDPKKSVIGAFEIQEIQTVLWSQVLKLKTNEELNKLILDTLKPNKNYIYTNFKTSEKFASALRSEFVSYLIQKNLKKSNLSVDKNVLLDFIGSSSNIAALEMGNRAEKLSGVVDEDLEFSIDDLLGNEMYKGDIETLGKNQIFVFGANDKGDHGAGSAGAAMGEQRSLKEIRAIKNNTQGKWAVKGSTGLMIGKEGVSYGLVTVEGEPGGKMKGNRMSDRKMIENIEKLYALAEKLPNREFFIAYNKDVNIKSFNGFTGEEMIALFNRAGTIPTNLRFSDKWTNSGLLNLQTKKKKEKIEFKYKPVKEIKVREAKFTTRAVTPGVSKTKKGVYSYSGELIINRELLYKEYQDKLFSENEYKNKFGYTKISATMFSSYEEYENFVIEREVQRIKIPKSSVVSLKSGDNIMFDIAVETVTNGVTKKIEDKRSKKELDDLIQNRAYELYLTNTALANTYNSEHLFKGENSIAKTYSEIILKYPKLKNKYEFFKGFVTDVKSANKLIVHPEKIVEVDLLESYYSDIVELSDPKIMKVDNVIDNALISDFFNNLKYYSLLQSGMKSDDRASFARIFDNQSFVNLISQDVNDINQGNFDIKKSFEEFKTQFLRNNETFAKRIAPKKYTEIDNTVDKINSSGPRYNYNYEFLTEESKGLVYSRNNYKTGSKLIQKRENLVVVHNSFMNVEAGDTNVVGDEYYAYDDTLKNKIGLAVNFSSEKGTVTDENSQVLKDMIDSSIDDLKSKQDSGIQILFNVDGYGQDLTETAPKLFEYLSKRLLELGFRNPNFIIEQKNYDYAADMQIESYPEEIVISFINSCR